MSIPIMALRSTEICPELELILYCTGIRLGRESQSCVIGIRGFDWNAVFRLAQEHKVLPLLYQGFKTLGPGLIPEPIQNRAVECFRANADRNFQLSRELIRVLDALDDHGISAVPFKGPTLAQAAYGDLALRQAGLDLDLLLLEDDIKKYIRLIYELGYSFHRRFNPYIPIDDCLKSPIFHHVVFKNAKTRSRLELHWKIKEDFWAIRFDPKVLHSRSVSFELHGKRVLSFQLEDLLLILCAHGSTHRWRQLRWVCDVASLIHAHSEIDWQAVAARAKSLRIVRVFRLGLLLASELSGASLPEGIVRDLKRDLAIPALGEEIQRRLPRDRQHVLDDTELDFYLRTRECLKDRINCCIMIGRVPDSESHKALPLWARFYIIYFLWIKKAITPNDKDLSLVSLPRCLNFIYYVVRPVRLVAKRVRSVLHLPQLLSRALRARSR